MRTLRLFLPLNYKVLWYRMIWSGMCTYKWYVRKSLLYFLRQLKRAKVPANDLLSFYIICIRPVVECACPVYHTSLPQYLSDQLECLQKRALRIISTNDLSYRQALEVFNIPTLYDRREAIGNSTFQEISNNNNHKLYSLLPPPYLGTLRTRKNREFQVPRFETNRFTYLRFTHHVCVAHRAATKSFQPSLSLASFSMVLQL